MAEHDKPLKQPPALARLSFRMPTEQVATFEGVYRDRVAPILAQHGLFESFSSEREMPDGIFCRLFEVNAPTCIQEMQAILHDDPEWQQLLKELGTAFGTDGALPGRLELYAAPGNLAKGVVAGPGEALEVGQGRGHWRTYDATDGLVSCIVWSMALDRERCLWIGTYGGGVCRFDGQNFVHFSTDDGLAHNNVRAVFHDRDGYLWFGTDMGVSRFDGQAFTTFTSQDGLVHNSVSSIFQDRQNNLWFGAGSFWGAANGGVSCYDGKRWQTFTTEDGLASNQVQCICEDRDGTLWFGTAGGGVARYNTEGWQTFDTADGLAHNDVSAIFEDREANLWFGTFGGGVSRYDGQTWQTFHTEHGLAHNWVYSILQDREGALWFGTVGSGVSRYDGETFVTLTTRDGLSQNFVHTMVEDPEGQLWFGTHSGLSCYDGWHYTTFTMQDRLMENGVRTIFQDSNRYLWFGTEGGACRYNPGSGQDGQTFTLFTTKDGLAHDVVKAIAEDDRGHLWFGTDGGASRFDGQTFTTFTVGEGLVDDRVTSVHQDQTGRLWFCTEGGGVSCYHGETFVAFTAADGLAHNVVHTVYEDHEGHLWFGTDTGLSCYDGNRFADPVLQQGTAPVNVSSIIQDREENFWFGTNGAGVSHYDGRALTKMGANFRDTMVQCVFQDRKGGFWFGTNGGGINRYDGQVLQKLNRRDGLSGNVVYSIFQDREDCLWFGTDSGVTQYRQPEPSPIPVWIDAVIVDRRYERPDGITTAGQGRMIIVEFRGVSLRTPPEAMVYRYRMSEHDGHWQDTHEQRVEYQNLPPGDYTFEVQAVDRDLNYSNIASVKLVVASDLRLNALTEALSGSGEFDEFVGRSDALHTIQTQLVTVAKTDVTVLIQGETGTGKGLAARAVHRLGDRKLGPFIQVNCGAIPEGLVESELFGHEKGAFTGAVSRKLGKVELSEGGTLFLDEIGDLALQAQVKLLRLLEERTFERVGGTEIFQTDARVIAATNRDLKQMVTEGTFREDLYFRLCAFPITMPPLRERREDIPLLGTFFMNRMASHLNKDVKPLTSEAISVLQAYDWPGNVRELEHVVQRAVIICREGMIRAEDIALGGESMAVGSAGEIVTLEAYERRYILMVLERTGWMIGGKKGAATLLGLPPSTLRSRMKKLGIERK